MTGDRGLAALAALVERLWPDWDEYAVAAAILGERGVFLPDGMHPTDDYAEIIDRWKAIAEDKERTIAALRAALEQALDRMEEAWKRTDLQGQSQSLWFGMEEVRAALATAEEAGK
jgi:hypothetical protein